jgi:hypothetical protein
MADEQYRNKTVINQKGATVEIINSADREDLKLSQFSGSNVTLNNVVNSELATNNKQTKVNNDSFESVAKNKNTFVGKDNIERVVENTYSLKGFVGDTQLDALSSWRDKMAKSEIPGKFGQFIQLRGGYAVPGVKGSVTDGPDGERAFNSTLNGSKFVLNNDFSAYCPAPIRKYKVDQVSTYEPVPEPHNLPPATEINPTADDVFWGSGPPDSATNAPGVVEYGPYVNSATEGGVWAENEQRTPEKLQEELEDIQEELNEIEQKIGNGGDEIEFIKRNKFVTIGGAVNNFPSIRVDPKGRSQPIEVAVGDKTSFTNVDYVPHVEEVNNDVNFPCGDYTLNIGNKYNVTVGSGGVQIKTSGSVEIGGTAVKIASNKLNLMASAGMHLHSKNLIELNSNKSISLRSKRQIYIDPNLGVKGNTVIGGGAYVEGELYVQHITAPVEIQQTEDTTLYGKFAVNCLEDKLVIGETESGEKVYADPAENLIVNYPHSHHFKNIPLKVMDSNEDVRRQAQCDGINKCGIIARASPQQHQRKPIMIFEGEFSEDSAVYSGAADLADFENSMLGIGRCDATPKDGPCDEGEEVTAEEECPVQGGLVDENSSSSSATVNTDSLIFGHQESANAGANAPGSPSGQSDQNLEGGVDAARGCRQ